MNWEGLFIVIAFVLVVIGLPLFFLGWLLVRWIKSKPGRAERWGAAVTEAPTAGYFKIAEIRGAPVRVHWSFPLGGLMLSAFTGFQLLPTLAVCLGYMILVLLHELGHVAAAWWLRLEVVALELSAAGGVCHTQPPRTVRDAYVLYSGGLIAQAILLAITLAYLAVFGSQRSPAGNSLILTFTVVNLVIMVANILPSTLANGLATDGHVLWNLYRHTRGRGAHPLSVKARPTRVLAPETALLSLREFVPDNFTVGVEILNDNTTPMEFVVTVLTTHLRLTRDKAIEVMLAVHEKGGVLLPIESLELAEAMASAVTRDAQERGHALVCRAVDARAMAAPAA